MRAKVRDSKGARVRQLLVERPEWTHARIAQDVGTTTGYVHQQASELRRREISLPDRTGARTRRPTTKVDGQHSEEGATTGETDLRDSAPEVVGVRYIRVQLTDTRNLRSPAGAPPPAEAAPTWRCSECKHTGPGTPPKPCPSCGK